MVKRDSAGSAARISTQSPSLNQLGRDCASVRKKKCAFLSGSKHKKRNFVCTCELK